MLSYAWRAAAGHDHLLRKWIWIFCLLLLSSFTQATESPHRPEDCAPRAALVSMVHEHDVHDILHSIQQLEESFNARYLYHWVFFSTSPLSDDFRRVTANATNATCIFEHIPASSTTLVAHNGAVDGAVRTRHDNTRPPRWNWASIAKADRLKDYDWFWRIEPGVRRPLAQRLPPTYGPLLTST